MKTSEKDFVIVDNLIDFIKEVKDAKERGKIIVVEEVSVLFPSKRAMSKDNVSIGKILETCRIKGVILICNAPLWPSIDSHMRALGHLLIECLYINKTQEVVVYKPLIIQTSPSLGKPYYHKMQRGGRDVHRAYTRMPNLETWNKYEDQKDKFLEETYTELIEEAEAKKKKKQKERDKTAPRTIVQSLTPRELEVYTLLRQNIKQVTIAKELGISEPRITGIVKNIREKTEITKENQLIRVKKGNTSPIKLN